MGGEKVKARLLSVSDLVAPEARYHVKCYAFFSRSHSSEPVGRKMTDKE